MVLSWLSKAFNTGRHIFGKVRSGIESGVRMFNKGKEMYSQVRQKISDLPVVGPAASAVISRMETKADDFAKRKLGIGLSDIDKGVSRIERASQYLPRT